MLLSVVTELLRISLTRASGLFFGSLRTTWTLRLLGAPWAFPNPEVFTAWHWKCKVPKEPILPFRIKLNHMKLLILTDFLLQNWQVYMVQTNNVLHILREFQIFWKMNLEANSQKERVTDNLPSQKTCGFLSLQCPLSFWGCWRCFYWQRLSPRPNSNQALLSSFN